MKKICGENFDFNGDGELSYREAAEIVTLENEEYRLGAPFFGRSVD